jgi:acylphosphatase
MEHTAFTDSVKPTPTLHFRVTGLVQGVWFRGWTQLAAQSLGLSGWVRNMPDGSVAGQAQGPQEALERFRLELRSGPPSARVDHLDAGYIDLPDRFDGFSVRY